MTTPEDGVIADADEAVPDVVREYVRSVLLNTLNTHLETVETRAVLAGWVAARQHGLLDVTTSDAIALAAVKAVWEQLRLLIDEAGEARP